MGGLPDVAIVGGGVIGCVIALRLAQAGAAVTLVERGAIGREASGASAGLISPPKPGLPGGMARARLEARSFGMYPALLAELAGATDVDVAYVAGGRLSVALSEAEEAALRETLDWQRGLGFDVDWRDGDAARRMVPALAPTIWGALWCAAAGSVRAAGLTLALARAAAAHGATIREGTPIEGFLRAGRRVAGVRTRGGDIHAGETVLAAGAWTAGLGELLDLTLPTRPVRGQMLALAGAVPPLRHAVAGAGGFLIPRADRTIAVAATVEEAGFDTRVTPDGLIWLATLIRTLAPNYADALVVATWAGLRPATADDLPLMGRAPGVAGLWVAAGHMRDGILWAPVVGELMAAAILGGTPDPALALFDPGRFAA